MKQSILPIKINGRKGVTYWVQSRLTAVRYHDDNILIQLCNGGRYKELEKMLINK